MSNIKLVNMVDRIRKNDSLVVVGRLSYPTGSAPSNRVHLYCKALKELKGFPFVVNLHSTFTEPQSFGYLGRNDGIPFYFPQKTPYKPQNLFLRNFNKIIGLVNTAVVVKKLQKDNRIQVLFYGTTFLDELFLFPFFKIWRISIIRECNEAPLYIILNRKHARIKNILLSVKLKMYDKLIVISDNLRAFYSKKFPNEAIFQIPILVDMDRFRNNGGKKNHEKKIITYAGYMGGNKDGLENLIESMLIVRAYNENVQLQLVGSAPESDMSKLRRKVTSLGLDDVILFCGRKKAEEIPELFSNSDVLVLARPDNNQAKAGFPTKLGEYLASAKPVVITMTGEITKYLQHNVSAYLAKADDIQDFAEKVIYALSDENSTEIGKKGYQVANNNFNYHLYGKEILKILQN
jgi:glycosyltransferase involved in cell wall biosynthesis